MPTIKTPAHRVRPQRMTALVLLAAAGLIVGGCRSAAPRQQPPADPLPTVGAAGLDPAALRNDVNGFAMTARTRVTGVASDIARATEDRTARESSVRWKIMVIPALDSARLLPDPRAALVGLWAICVRQRVLFEGPAGEENFTDQVETVRRTAHELEDEIVAIAKRYVPAERVAEVSAELERRAADSPVISDYIEQAASQPSSDGEENPIATVLELPLLPVSAVTALGDTPEEIRNFANVAAGFSQIARDIPEQSRWQLELLMLESEDHPVFKDTQRLGLAAESVAQTAKKLQEAIDRADGPITTIHDTVVEARATAAKVDEVAARAERIAASIDQQADAVSRTAAAAESTVKAVHDLLDAWVAANPPQPEPPPGTPPPKPFDINEYTTAVDHAHATIAEARGLLADLQTSPLKARLAEVDAAAKDSIDHATDRLNGVVSRLVWSLAAVIVLGIAAWFVARLLLYRLTGANAAPGR